MKAKETTPSERERFNDYMLMGEAASMYLSGLADAFDVAGNPDFKSIIHHLRYHANELDMGTLWVKHAYKEDNDRSK